jgi:hypothetical protein
LPSLEELYLINLNCYTQANGSSDNPDPNYNVGNGIDGTAFEYCRGIDHDIIIYGSQPQEYWENAPWSAGARINIFDH